MAYPTKLVSVTKSGILGNQHSGLDGTSNSSGSVNQNKDMAAISQSSDGRYIVFASLATSFDSSDTDQLRDIYLKDMTTGDLKWVSTGQSFSDTRSPEVSDDGRYVVFEADDKIHRRDMLTGTIEQVSKDIAGNNISGFDCHMTPDGRYVVFNSSAGNPGGKQQVYVRDMVNGTTARVSVDSDGTTLGNNDSEGAYISNDGTKVVFQSKATNFADDTDGLTDSEIFIKNLVTGALTRISEKADGTGGVAASLFGNSDAMISGNGRYVVFESGNNDLAPLTNSTINTVIYRKDLLTGNIDVVSTGKTGQNTVGATNPSITADGRFILFKTSLGSAGDTALIPENIQSKGTLSPDFLSFYYIKDMATGEVHNIDMPRGSMQLRAATPIGSFLSPKTYLAPYISYNATISADGKYVTLASIQTLDKSTVPNEIIDQNYQGELEGNNDNQFDVFRIDVSKITSKAPTAQTQTGGDSVNDVLIGGLGADKLVGLGGDDDYIVELIQSGTGAKTAIKLKHTVVEAKDKGVDSIELVGSIVNLLKAATINIPNFVENLDLSKLGNALLNVKGNIENNVITGNAGNNLLEGLAGNDTLNGGGGNDTLIGGAGIDALLGGLGDDIYVQTLKLNLAKTALELEDAITEALDAGSDTVNFTGIASLLSAFAIDLNDAIYDNIENINLSATGTSKNLNLTGDDGNNWLIGNKAANTLIGNGGNDTLNGDGGADRMEGGLGNDTYYVDNTGDQVIENLDEGQDLVVSSLATYTLAENVENLVLSSLSKTALKGFGNSLNNGLFGNDKANELSGADGDDLINGGLGNDKLTGGNGDDTFVFDKALKGNSDTITDFISGSDKILLDKTVFTQLTGNFVDAGNIVFANSTATAKAGDADDYLIYDQSTGKLSYDADGSGSLAAQTIVTLIGTPSLDVADIVFTAAAG